MNEMKMRFLNTYLKLKKFELCNLHQLRVAKSTKPKLLYLYHYFNSV